MEHLRERDADGGIVGVGLHDVGHICPPLLHDGVAAEILGTLVALDLLIGEEDVGVFVPVDGVVPDSGVGKELLELGENRGVASFVLFLAAALEEHLEGFASGHGECLLRLV